LTSLIGVPKIRYAGMLQYDCELLLPKCYLVSPPEIDRTCGEYLVKNGVHTFACRQVYLFFRTSFIYFGNRNIFLLIQYYEKSISRNLLVVTDQCPVAYFLLL
jgi:hypothetical protein